MTSANRVPRKMRLFYDPKVRKRVEVDEAIRIIGDQSATRQQKRAAERQLAKHKITLNKETKT